MTAPASLDLPAVLDDLERAHAVATPGPWQVAPGGGIDAGDYDRVIGRGDVECMAYCYGGTSTIEGDNLAADAALIVAAVNAVPTLIAELRKRDAALRTVADLADDWKRYRVLPTDLADRLTAALAAHLAPATPPAQEDQP